MKLWKPKFFENSKVPEILSKVAPIHIWAINIGPFVWCNGVLSELDKRLETIGLSAAVGTTIRCSQRVLYFVFYA